MNARPIRRTAAMRFAEAVGLAARAAATIAIAAACLVPIAASGADAPVALKEMLGVYLGRASVKDLDTKDSEERDIDVEIMPYERTGFRIRWVNVTLVDGRRNVPGVKRRVSELTFRPGKGAGFFVEAPEVNVFAEREETTPMGGDPVRWAILDGAGLHIHSFVILEDGRYELQTYSRKRNASGISLHYERILDGTLQRTIDGLAVKVQ